MLRPLRIQYPNAPPAPPERLATRPPRLMPCDAGRVAGRVVSRYEQGEEGCDKAFGVDRAELHESRRGFSNQPRNVAIYLLGVHPEMSPA